MYVYTNISLRSFFIATWKIQLMVLAVCSLGTLVYIHLLNDLIPISKNLLTVLGTAEAFFIGFINAQAYDRWWEARKIWGSIVNDSRSLGRMVMSYFTLENAPQGTMEEMEDMRQGMIHRHISWLYATKERLRDIREQKHRKYLSPEENRFADTFQHIPNGISILQGKALDEVEQKGYIDSFRMLQINDMLNRFSDSIGKAERIKTTVFPTFYLTLNKISIWTFIVIMPITMAEDLGYWAILYSFIIGIIYELTLQAGITLMNPFENQPADTPMSSITRNIEINLLEMLGEKDLPEPVKPVRGEYLM
jgi:putative membrane protein